MTSVQHGPGATCRWRDVGQGWACRWVAPDERGDPGGGLAYGWGRMYVPWDDLLNPRPPVKVTITSVEWR